MADIAVPESPMCQRPSSTNPMQYVNMLGHMESQQRDKVKHTHLYDEDPIKEQVKPQCFVFLKIQISEAVAPQYFTVLFLLFYACYVIYQLRIKNDNEANVKKSRGKMIRNT